MTIRKMKKTVVNKNLFDTTKLVPESWVDGGEAQLTYSGSLLSYEALSSLSSQKINN